MSPNKSYDIAAHDNAVSRLAVQVRAFHDTKTPFRINHGSTNSTRTLERGTPTLNISHLNHILKLSPATDCGSTATLLVEPNVALDQVLDFTLPHKLIPPVVMEFPGITVGGGFSGASGESSSFKYGLFDGCVERVEMLLGDGRVVWAGKRRDFEKDEASNEGVQGIDEGKLENGDLFMAARCGLGTLGVVTLLEIRLIAAKDFVEVEYLPVSDKTDMTSTFRELCEGNGPDTEHVDYIDGILFSADSGVIIKGRMVDGHKDSKGHVVDGTRRSKVRTFNKPWDPWFYQHAQEIARRLSAVDDNLSKLPTYSELIPIRDYLFRYDRGAFWTGMSFFEYFGMPCNALTVCLFDYFLHTRKLYKAMHATRNAERNIVQDLMIPLENVEPFLVHVEEGYNIWPLWLCPVKRIEKDVLLQPFASDGKSNKSASDSGSLMLNIGVWGKGTEDVEQFVAANRKTEAKLKELSGRKVLYAHTFYDEHDFWDLFDQARYDSCRARYGAETLPSVWDKVKPISPLQCERAEVEKRARFIYILLQRLLMIWPLAGIYSMIMALWP